MKLKCFSVHDSAVGAFLPPFFLTSDGAARRLFILTCQDGGHMFFKNPQDYVLFSLGEFDDSTGQFSGPTETLITGLDAKGYVPISTKE